MCSPESFCDGHRFTPRQREGYQISGSEVGVDLGERRAGLGLGDRDETGLRPEDREAEGVAQFVPLQGSEGERSPLAFDVGHCRGRVRVTEIERHQERGVSDRSSRSAESSSAKFKAARSGCVAKRLSKSDHGRLVAGAEGGGPKVATILRREVMAMVSPSFTALRRVGKARRISRTEAVFMVKHECCTSRWSQVGGPLPPDTSRRRRAESTGDILAGTPLAWEMVAP